MELLLVFLLFVKICECFVVNPGKGSRFRSKSVVFSSSSLTERVKHGVLARFKDEDISRVVQCWDDFAAGKCIERYLGHDVLVCVTFDLKLKSDQYQTIQAKYFKAHSALLTD